MSDNDSLDVTAEHGEAEWLSSVAHAEAGDAEGQDRVHTMAGPKILSMAEHLAAARSDLRVSMPGDVPFSKFVKEVQRREQAEVELDAQRQVNADIMLQLQDQIEANMQLSTALEKASSSTVGERQKRELISMQLQEVMKEQYELFSRVQEKSTKAEYSERKIEEIHTRYRESASKTMKKYENMLRKSQKEGERYQEEASLAIEKVQELEMQLREEQEQCRVQQNRTTHLEEINASLKHHLESEKEDARNLRMQIARSFSTESAGPDGPQILTIEKTLEKVRGELRKALEAKEKLSSEVDRLKKQLDSLQTHADAVQESHRVDKKSEAARHTQELRRIEQRFLCEQKRQEEDLVMARKMQAAAEASRDEALLELGQTRQSSKEGGQVRRGLVERAEAAEEKAVALEAERVLLQAQLSNLRKELATLRAETEERGREVERTKVQAVAAIERRKTVEEELFGAKEQLVLLQGAVEKDRTALRAITESAETRASKTTRLETELTERREEVLRLERSFELKLEEDKSTSAAQIRHLEASVERAEHGRRTAEHQLADEQARHLHEHAKAEHCEREAEGLRRELEEAETQLLEAKASLAAARSEASRLRADLPHLADCLRVAEENNIVMESRCKVLEMERKFDSGQRKLDSGPRKSDSVPERANATAMPQAPQTSPSLSTNHDRGGIRDSSGVHVNADMTTTRKLDFPSRLEDVAGVPRRKEDSALNGKHDSLFGSRSKALKMSTRPSSDSPQAKAQGHRDIAGVSARPTTRRRPNSATSSPHSLNRQNQDNSPSLVASLPAGSPPRPKSAGSLPPDAFTSASARASNQSPTSLAYARYSSKTSVTRIGTQGRASYV